MLSLLKPPFCTQFENKTETLSKVETRERESSRVETWNFFADIRWLHSFAAL